ncbi:hypothetical protein LCGC14_0615970 [marine sediment metagenome]|uniref:Uncharacterized protein n=1 Tax=marine sediment metagenome TaxID=412755 RepID=A0A0F9UET1_9ZZZZ
MSYPLGNLARFFFSSEEPATIAETSACSIEAHVDGKGLFVSRFDNADISLGMTLTANASPLINANITVITPVFVSLPGHTLQTIIRQGRISAGTLPGASDYIIRSNQGRVFDGSLVPLFIAPGWTLTFLRSSVNSAMSYSAIIDEVAS